MSNRINRLLVGAIAVTTLFSARSVEAAAPATDWKETASADEATFFATIAKEINGMQDKAAADSGTPVDRGFHAKAHSVVKGELTVEANIPEALRQGAFRQVATYPTWVRFSNGQGNRQADRKPDVRGMALKILNVPGENLTAGQTSFDLLGINHPVQPARDIKQFIAFVRAASNPLTLPFKLAASVGALEAGRIIKWAAMNLGGRVRSMAAQDFWTTLPLTWGPYAVKVRFKPNQAPATGANTSDADYLRTDLKARLKAGDLTWDVMVQPYVNPTATPIEDASVNWNPEVSPWVKVATLKVRRCDLDSPSLRAEEIQGNKMLFNPWNAPQDHRPLGSLMRARRVVYPASGTHRGAVIQSPAR